MKRIAAILAAALTLSCGSLPDLRPVNDYDARHLRAKCASSFLAAQWRFIHSIEAALPNGDRGSMMGVTVADPVTRSIHCVIMTIEGLVLFEAKSGADMQVMRAIPPFDNMSFARSLMDDVSLVYFEPAMEPYAGKVDECSVCRYKDKVFTVDLLAKGGGWEIRKYSQGKSLIRVVKASDLTEDGLPRKIHLRAPGMPGYSLFLNLIEAERVK